MFCYIYLYLFELTDFFRHAWVTATSRNLSLRKLPKQTNAWQTVLTNSCSWRVSVSLWCSRSHRTSGSSNNPLFHGWLELWEQRPMYYFCLFFFFFAIKELLSNWKSLCGSISFNIITLGTHFLIAPLAKSGKSLLSVDWNERYLQ